MSPFISNGTMNSLRVVSQPVFQVPFVMQCLLSLKQNRGSFVEQYLSGVCKLSFTVFYVLFGLNILFWV